MKEKKVITQEEVQQAIRKFQERGGLIRRLPDEIVTAQALVGARYSVYEYAGDMAVGVDAP
jgi:hypothetical protein